MTTELVPIATTPTAQALDLVEPSLRLVEQIANTTFVPNGYRGKPAELLACILTGAELGVGPMTAIAKIHNVQGRSGLSSELARALVLSKGHDLWIEESAPSRVTVAGQRSGSERVTRITWSLEMADRAGLKAKENWRKYPQAMLLARATGDLCRAVFADVLAGISYMSEELDDGFDLDDSEPLEVEAQTPPADAPAAPPADDGKRSKPKRTRKKAADKPAAAMPRPPEPPLPGEPGYEEPKPPAGEKTTEEKRATMVAIRFGEVLAHLDRAQRLAFYTASAGRPISTGKELTSAEVDGVLVDLARVEAGEAEWDSEHGLVDVVEGLEVEAEVVATLDDAPSWSDENWRDYIRAKGVKLALVMREAQRLAEVAGLASPGTLVEVAAMPSAQLEALRGFVDGEAK